MRSRDIELRRSLLEKKVESIREKISLPSDDELLLLRYQGWDKLLCTVQERMLLSAWIRLKARENGDTFALISSRPKGRKLDEIDAERLYQYLSGVSLVHYSSLSACFGTWCPTARMNNLLILHKGTSDTADEPLRAL